jgi:hypothetical protein
LIIHTVIADAERKTTDSLPREDEKRTHQQSPVDPDNTHININHGGDEQGTHLDDVINADFGKRAGQKRFEFQQERDSKKNSVPDALRCLSSDRRFLGLPN